MSWARSELRDACYRVRTIAGVERGAFWTVVLFTVAAGAMAGFAGAWALIVVLVLAAIGVLAGARRLMARDPMALRIFLATLGERDAYLAVGRYDQKPRVRQIGRRTL